jgi:hypothetical protein
MLFRVLLIVGAILLGAGSARSDDGVHVLGVSGGLGFSFPLDDSIRGQNVEGSGNGGWLEAEYVYRATEWITPRAYSGLTITVPANDCGPMVSPCDVSARIFFVGAKVRLLIPIPYVAPFVESGIGASAGSMTTRSGSLVNVTSDGLMFHIPVGVGLAIGSKHQYEVSFQYLFHPKQRQFNGALALGLSFPLR